MLGWLLLLIPLFVLLRWSTRHRADEVRARIVEVLAAATRRGLPLELAPLRMGTELPRAERGRIVELERLLADGEPVPVALGRAFPRLFRTPAAHEVPASADDVTAELVAMAAASRRRGVRRERVLLALLYPLLLLAGALALHGALENLNRLPGIPTSHVFLQLPSASSLAGTLGMTVAAVVGVGVVTSALAGRIAAVHVCVDQVLTTIPVTGRCRRLRQTATALRALASGRRSGVPLDRSVAHAATALEGTELGRRWRGAAHLLAGGDPPSDVVLDLRLPEAIRHRLTPALRHADDVAATCVLELAAECDSRAARIEARAVRWIRPAGLLLAGLYLFVCAHYLVDSLDHARAEAMPW